MIGLERDQVKTYLSIEPATIDYDSFIDNEIEASLSELFNYTGYDKDNKRFYFYGDLTDDKFEINTVMLDAQIYEVLGFDSEDNQTDLTSFISQISPTKWKITDGNSYTRVKVTYTSDTLFSSVIGLLRELVIYRVQKLPAFGNFISRTSADINGVGSESFLGEELFLDRLRKRFAKLFMVNV